MIVVAKEYGGFTDVARMLGTSRQQVYVWWRRRSRNRFPEREEVQVKGKPGTVKKLFKLADVVIWHDNYVPGTGGRPRLD